MCMCMYASGFDCVTDDISLSRYFILRFFFSVFWSLSILRFTVLRRFYGPCKASSRNKNNARTTHRSIGSVLVHLACWPHSWLFGRMLRRGVRHKLHLGDLAARVLENTLMKIHVTCVCACVHLGLTVSADDISLSRYLILGLFFQSSGPFQF